jgi:HK97 family phage major capsid protein
VTITFPALTEAEGKLDLARKALKSVFDEAGPTLDMALVKSVDGDAKAKVEWIRTKNAEIDDHAKTVEGLLAVQKAAEGVKADDARREERKGAERGDGSDGKRSVEAKSFGELFTGSQAYKGRQGSTGPEAHLDIEVKALMTTGAGWAPEVTRTGRVVEFATRPIQIIDLIPSNTTSQSAIKYMEETTFVNNAAETAEGSQYAEAQLQLTERISPVQKIAVWLPVTDEQLEDEAQARGYINNRLPFMLRQRLDSQILNGNGASPNLRGILNTTGLQTQAKGSDPVPDAVYKAMTKVRVGGRAMPNAVVMHPTDWQGVRLLRTADGIYIWGSPSEAGPDRIWGLPVAQSDAIVLGTGLTGDTSFAELDTRRGVDVQVSNSHADFFINGKQAVRADVRVAVVFYRPAAFCTFTGL